MKLIPLRAGPLEMLFDVENAFLRHLRLGHHELVRGIFAAVRDRNWDTVPGRVDQLQLDRGENRFSLTFVVAARADSLAFDWKGKITGDSDGTVVFDFAGIARSSFLKNRIGLCVLHPIRQCAGRPCRIEHVDGTITESRFPLRISPHQPFKDIRSITSTDSPACCVTLEGETFEMEDQRNWTDASYKTYSTPLELPFPVPIEAGDEIRHRVTVRLLDAATSPPAQRDAAQPRFSEPRSLPSIGFGYSGSHELLKLLRPGHLRVDLHLGSGDWQSELANAASAARTLGTQLHLALFLTDAAEEELNTLLDILSRLQPPIGLWLVFHIAEKSTDARWVDLARQRLAEYDANIPLASGTNAYFAELNRGRPPSDSPAMPCFSINPQVHAFDNLSLVETLEAQRVTVESTREFASRPVVISPITLRPRFNPNATDPDVDATPQSDPRQSTVFAAAWTLGSLAELATSPEVHSLTYFETVGPRGLIDASGRAFPMYYVFRAVAEGRDCKAARVDFGRPLHVAGLSLTGGGRRRILIAGLMDEPTTVQMTDVPSGARVRLLEPKGWGDAAALSSAGGNATIEVPGESVVMVEHELEDDEA